jgi:hypothetical protein
MTGTAYSAGMVHDLRAVATAVPPDDVLVAGLRAGDEELFARLLDGWSTSMLRLARTFVSTNASGELVGLVAAFLEGALDSETERLFVEHLASCEGCEIYVEQMRRTIDEVGQLPPESLSGETRDRLLDAFRNFPRDP